MKKIFSTAIGVAILISSMLTIAACGDGGKKDIDLTGRTELVIDGGGQNANFNSSSSMIYDPYANPYPYNTLETLADEWNAEHPESAYYFTVAESSINNDRETMVPALNQGTAPEILYYLSTGSEDLTKNWFVDLTEYFERPNPYSKEGEAGSVRWKDIYSQEEFSTTYASNGKKYTAEIELNPIGILYNKTIFDAAGIEKTPDTFKEFMEAQDAIHAYGVEQKRADPAAANYLTPYYFVYPWYNGTIESAIYGEMIPYYDVISPNGVVDAEEFVRAYMKKDNEGNKLYSPDDDKMYEVARLIRLKSKYFPTNFESYYAEQQFVQGNLAMVEVTGGDIRTIVDAVGDDFEVGVFSYPIIENQPADEPENEYYTTENPNNNYVRRGFSGYSSGWAVTCSAMNKGDDAVAACIDFLQYVTCYENNDRLINDKGFSIPLSGNSDYSFFTELGEDYNADKENEDSLAWAAVSAGGNMNKEYYDRVYLTNIAFVTATDEEIGDLLTGLVQNFQNAANTLYTQNSWDVTKWPEYEEIAGNLS